MRRSSGVLLVAFLVLVFAIHPVGAETSSPIAIAPDGSAVWVVNPDSDTVTRLDPATNAVVGEFGVGHYPRTLAVTGTHVWVANQFDDTVTRLTPDGAPAGTAVLPFGCAPYGVAPGPDGASILVTCQGTSQLVVLGRELAVAATITLPWPEARAVAVGPGGAAYVTHFITKEPNHTGHVSEVDLAAAAVTRVLDIPPDFATCETTATGQGIANLLGAAVVAARGTAGQLWVGGTLHNVLRKGLFERSRYFRDQPGIALFPDLDFQSNPAGEGQPAHRNIYKAGLQDIARGAIWKLDLASGTVVARLDVANAGQIAGVVASADGGVAFAVDQMTNGFYVMNAGRGEDGNPASVFGPVSAAGPGGASPAAPCSGNAADVVPEDPYILAPAARLVPTGGMEPLDAGTLAPVDTGLEYTVATGLMRGVPDGVGTTPIGLALAPDGSHAFVASYLARAVTVVNAAPSGFRCQHAPTVACASRLECSAGDECMPLVRAAVSSTSRDPLPPQILDGKILFSTAARDAAGTASPIPPWNALSRDGTTNQGEVTSTARNGGSLACTSCHPDFGGNDGRTWDFSQFGSSLRNTMDLRGRASFAPGRCSHDATVRCTTDYDCGPFGSDRRCRNDPAFVPPNIAGPKRDLFFNPMGTTHWNGDRDEVEDFEFTFRELLGASDCDGQEDKPETCVGALVVRRFTTDPAPIDVRVDLSPEPNRGRTQRLDDLGDFVYSLTGFPRNPNLGGGGAAPSASAERGRRLFNDPVVHCSFCHNGPSGDRQLFTNKRPNQGYDPGQTPRADLNSPYLRFDVGTTNVFDQTNPFDIANDKFGLLGFTLFHNEQNLVPGNRTTLNAYLTTPLNDVWNTAPYLHDGSAPTLLDVVRPCTTRLDDCLVAGRGRNLNDQHGVTSFLTARQLNDLAAFEQAARGPIDETIAVHGAVLTLRQLQVKFGKKPGKDRLVLAGTADLSQDQSLDPAAEGVTFSIGVPVQGTMAVFEVTAPPGAGRRGTLHYADRATGLRSLAVKVKRSRFAARVAVQTDLSRLRIRDPDYTVGFEIGDDAVALTRRFATNTKGTVTKVPGKPHRRAS